MGTNPMHRTVDLGRPTWEPIETAPKDGTSILLASTDGKFRSVDQAEWDGEDWICIGGKRNGGDSLGGYRPYAWMPLPIPPNEPTTPIAEQTNA